MIRFIRPFLLITLFFQGCNNINKIQLDGKDSEQIIITPDSLFQLVIDKEADTLQLTPPKNSDFDLPDSDARIHPYHFQDFNGNGKEDVLVYIGACGTGGCMYGLFLNQYENYYSLVYNDYLKSPDFKKEENGFVSMSSYEEYEAFDPSKLSVSVFAFDPSSAQYILDTAYIYYDTLGQ